VWVAADFGSELESLDRGVQGASRGGGSLLSQQAFRPKHAP